MDYFFLISSGLAFLMASLLIVALLVMLVRLTRGVLPLLEEAHTNVRELGELANSTVTHASATLDLVETRVTRAMTDANVGGQEVSKRGMNIASAVAGIYLSVRLVSTVRSFWSGSNKKGKKGKRKKLSSGD